MLCQIIHFYVVDEDRDDNYASKKHQEIQIGHHMGNIGFSVCN